LIRAWPDDSLEARGMAVGEQGKGHPGMGSHESRDAFFLKGFPKISDKKNKGLLQNNV
jgi:hypothetical protein